MFGNNDTQQQPADSTNSMQAAMPDPITDSSLDTTAPAVENPVFGTPSGAPSFSPALTPDFSAPEITSSAAPSLPSEPSDSMDTTITNDSPVNSDPSLPKDDLMDLKQQALQHLSPLVSHLDQTPEEKFRTTMMMIQASDDRSLIKSAFEAAQQITDDKARAQALLDVINEINYFTQHTPQE